MISGVRAMLYTAAAILAALPGATQAQPTAEFRNWWAACDEQRTCWAFGLARYDAEQLGFVRVERGGAAAAEPALLLGAPFAWPWLSGGPQGRAAPTTLNMRVSVDGAPGSTLTARADDVGYYIARVADPGAARSLITAMRNGRTLHLRLPGKLAPTDVSLAGATAALLWIDDQQKRVGTTTAMARPGPRPASAVPPVPPMRVVRAAAPVSQAGLPTTIPARAWTDANVRFCRDELPNWAAEPLVARLEANVLLWGLRCSMGAYNTAFRLWLGDAQGGNWRRIPLSPPLPKDDTYLDVWGADYDAARRTLTGWYKGRGVGDCGTGSEWVWTGRAFVLIKETTMGPCQGVPSDYWPVTVRADVRR